MSVSAIGLLILAQMFIMPSQNKAKIKEPVIKEVKGTEIHAFKWEDKGRRNIMSNVILKDDPIAHNKQIANKITHIL